MRRTYYAETDSLYIDFSMREGVDAREVASGVVIDLDHEGIPVGIGFDRASKTVDLTTFEAVNLPFQPSRLGAK